MGYSHTLEETISRVESIPEDEYKKMFPLLGEKYSYWATQRHNFATIFRVVAISSSGKVVFYRNEVGEWTQDERASTVFTDLDEAKEALDLHVGHTYNEDGTLDPIEDVCVFRYVFASANNTDRRPVRI